MSKDLDGKLTITTLVPEFLEGIADVRMHGNEKHGEDTWKEVPNKAWIDAIYRHVIELHKGNELNEKDWGHHHALHIACSAMFLYHNYLKSVETTSLDERLRKIDAICSSSQKYPIIK